MGSDITLSCTISRLLDTVNLHWKQRALFRKNGRDKIHLNNTVYLLVRSIRRLDVNLYTCEVQKNGTAIITENIYVNQVKYDFHDVEYTCFRSSTVHSEFHLVSNTFFWTFHDFTWTWKSDRYPNQDEQIASFPPLHLKKTYFGSRIITSSWYYMTSIQITPVLFGDAGVYTLTADSAKRKTIKLIIVKVTTEPSDAETEEDSITLTCSVSDVTESIRLVWINSIGKVVAEKTVTGHNEKEKSLHLIIQKADRVKGNWTCVLLHQNSPKVIIPYYLEITRNTVFFSENSNNFVLNGPEHAGNGPVTWEWKPHSGQQLTKQLGIFHSDVTVEPSDAVTEGDPVTLTCSVSNVTEAIRLAWINSDGKSVLEKTLTGQNGEEKSLSLIIQKADRCKWHWMCVLFDQNNPRVLIPHNLEITRRSCMDTWILAFSGYLLVKLIIAIGLITSFKMKIKQKSG
ncbi:hypothetical protein chiPu_0019111 [Chiloscyllium punctatum]|uniref:Ig-like domain-containing protein n=1 Tax=Chiloscyllium punctatum TaxID=137246 RepID=A0A401RQQ4_CHIPU|nr:hypothetical protein [Chiloscyllium punctatum]